jgi:replicative DNA helicase
MILSDPPSERAILAGICRYGSDAYYDVHDIIDEKSFTINSNSIIYSCLKKIMTDNDQSSIDVALILSAAQSIGLSSFFSSSQEINHLGQITKFPVLLENIRRFAVKVKKLQIARLMYDNLGETRDKYLTLNGEESIASILGIAEDSIFSFSSLLSDMADGPKKVFSDINEYIDEKTTNKVDQIGIPTGFSRYDFAIGGGLRRGTVNVLGARPKCQPLFASVLTSSGWKFYSEIEVGDKLCHPDGKTTNVIEVLDTGVKPVYEFEFSDGSKTWACEDHRWKVKSRRWKDGYKTLSWKDMKDLSEGCENYLYENDRPKWRFPLTKPVEFEQNKTLPIDPYIMGILISEGSITNSVKFSTGDESIVEYIQNNIDPDYKVKRISKYDYSITNKQRGKKTNIYKEHLKDIGLLGLKSKDKFIPSVYLLSSVEDRYQLLRGLLDGDGSGGKTIEYSTASSQLADDMIHLVRSLGGLATKKFRQTRYETDGKWFGSYRIHIRFNNNIECFNLHRKKAQCNIRSKPDLKRSLVKVGLVGNLPTRCIRVDAQDEMYITNDFIPTKNCGKTTAAINIATNIARQKIPVLFLDTEMKGEDHKNKGLSIFSFDSKYQIPINKIETGHFDPKKAKDVIKEYSELPYYFNSIGGMPFEEQLSVMRRWIAKEVGINDNGKAKDCVIIYDYLKLMDDADIKGDMKEFQVLGFRMTALHNFSLKYDIPILCFIQLNRDGITKESTDTASGSDRIIWLCSNFSILKVKSDEEIAKDGSEYGNRKLVPVIARHGEGLELGDYINVDLQGRFAKMIEKETSHEIENGISYVNTPKQKQPSGFSSEEEEIAF